jgi:predicted pyridoxine 5'-phosphate oxidase superfamily flavin-nucleotide-binding protein
MARAFREEARRQERYNGQAGMIRTTLVESEKQFVLHRTRHPRSQAALAEQSETERHGFRNNFIGFATSATTFDALTARERDFLAVSDTFFIAGKSQTGWPHVQHRGGPPGFVRVLNEKTIGWAEFAGNGQYVSAGTTDADSRVALLFMKFSHRKCLKLLGCLHGFGGADRPDLALRCALDGYSAEIEHFAVLTVEGLDWNDPQHITPRFTANEIAAMARGTAIHNSHDHQAE